MQEEYIKKVLGKRKSIPSKIADEVMYLSDLRCCVCESQGVHIHHLDGDPSNNDIQNLALLCFQHHNEASSEGGLSRKLSPGTIIRYRETHYRKVAAHRTIPNLLNESQNDSGLSDERLFQLMLDAVVVNEVHKISQSAISSGWEDAEALVSKLASYPESIGFRARRAILQTLDDLASDTRRGMTTAIGQAIAQATYNTLPIRTLRAPANNFISTDEQELLEYGADIGSGLAYDGALYLKNARLAYIGSDLLWKILRYCRINKLDDLQKQVMEHFDIAEDGARRSGNSDALSIVTINRNHGLSGDWRPPKYPDALFDNIIGF